MSSKDTTKISPLAVKVAAAEARRASLKAKGSANVLPTTYHQPDPKQAEELLIALMADADWRNEIEQEETSGNTVFVYRKRNLAAGEQPTIVRFAYNSEVEDLVLTRTGYASPAGFDIEQLHGHDIAELVKAAAKKKAEQKAENKRALAFAKLGF